MLVRTILNPELLGNEPEEMLRFNTLVAYAQPDVTWSVRRIINLNNYNRCYLGVNSIVDTEPLVNHMLDPSIAEKALTFSSDDKSISDLLIQEGIQVIEGPYRSGKSSLIPKLISGYNKMS